MSIILTIVSGPENLKASGNGRKVFDFTRRAHGYYVEEDFIPFTPFESFELIANGRETWWTELVNGPNRIKLIIKHNRLYGEPAGGQGEPVMEWIREAETDSFAVPVAMEEEWYTEPYLEFSSQRQYESFINHNVPGQAEVLNALYTSHEKTPNVDTSSSFVLLITGSLMGRLALLRPSGAVLLQYDAGDVIEDGNLDISEVGPGIYFKLYYGQMRARISPPTGRVVIRECPSISPDAVVGENKWVPQVNQYVRVQGVPDTFIIKSYIQNEGRFSLILADEEIRKKDMERSKRPEPRSFVVAGSRLRPVLMEY